MARESVRESAGQPAREEERVERILTDELASVETPEAADQIVGRIERMASGATAGQRGQQAAQAPGGAADQVESVSQTTPGPGGTAEVLTTAAAQVAAPNEQAAPAAQAAGTALPPAGTAPTPDAERGRRLLREAMLRRMGPLQRMDARLFLAINTLPHPTWANVLADGITVITTGGWIWLIGLAIARILGVTDNRRALRLAAPSIIGATSAVEWPIKALFRRRRPFIDIVRALVIGRRPDGWSFPSGHTAAAFSGAWVLSTIWPKKSPIFFALASTVGLSRVYVGAHYPGDVFSGATLGMLIAEAIRRPVSRLIR